MSDPRIIVALDFAEAEQARQLVKRLAPGSCRLKVGKELFTRSGPALVSELTSAGFEVFLDLKYHDIPHTVARACAAAADLGVWMLNVHALGGKVMMEAAREAIEQGTHRPHLIAVTLLTSMGQEDLEAVGLAGTPEDNVVRLAALAQTAGMDGVVCSPREAATLRAKLGGEFCLVTPGIRPQGAAVGDQKRVMTPGEALRAGADYLVIGRPITAAPDPKAALAALQSELQGS